MPAGDWRQSGQLVIAVVSAIAIFLIHLSLAPVVLAQNEDGETANPSLRNVIAGVPRSWPPQYSVDENGNPTGFAIDVMDEIAARTGLRVDYRVMDSFAEVSEAMRAGDIDLIPNSGITHERQAEFDFTSPVETFVVSIFVRDDTLDIRGLDDLAGRRVGVVEFNIGQALMKNRQDISSVVYRDAETALFSLVAGHVDAMAFPQPVLLHLAKQVGIADRIKVAGAPLKELKRAIRVQKGDTELLVALNRAVNSFVGTPDYRAIYVKWYGSPTPFWTVARVAWGLGVTALMILIAMAWWRYRSVLNLNRELQETIAERQGAENALRKSQERFKDFAETASDWFWETNESLRFTYFSNRFGGCGIGSNEMFGKTRTETTAEDTSQPKWRQHLADLEARRPFKNFEHSTWARDGGLARVSISGTPIFDEAGNFKGYRGTGTDITDRKQVEEALRAREAQLRGIMDNAPIEIVLKDTEGHYVLTNAQWQENYNLTDEEAKGRTLHDLFPEEIAKPLSAQEHEVMETGEAAAYEDKVPQSDGVHDFLTVMFPIRDTAGEVVNFGAMAVDITERKRAEEALRESEARLSKAAEMAKIGYWVWDEVRDKSIYCSDELVKMCGIASGADLAAMLTSHAANLEWIHPDDRERFDEAVRTAKETKRGYDIEYRIVNSEGEVRHLHEMEETVADQHGDIIRTNGVTHDITDRKRVEEEIRELNAELEQRVEERTAELRAAQANLLHQERMATLGQLTATVSHELRNPLGVIQTSNAIVRNYFKDCDPRVGRSLERIERNVMRCDRIIDELLDFTRIRQLEPEPTPIDTWLDDVLEEQTLHTDITLRRELGLPGVKVFLDHYRFRRAVINVLDNACQAMVGDGSGNIEEGKHILTIQTGKTNGRIEVVFEDNGPGIPPDVLPKIFEPMFSTKGFGVGLGLPVVKQIMEQHGGGIEIDSEQGCGTRTCLWLSSDHAVH